MSILTRNFIIYGNQAPIDNNLEKCIICSKLKNKEFMDNEIKICYECKFSGAYECIVCKIALQYIPKDIKCKHILCDKHYDIVYKHNNHIDKNKECPVCIDDSLIEKLKKDGAFDNDKDNNNPKSENINIQHCTISSTEIANDLMCKKCSSVTYENIVLFTCGHFLCDDCYFNTYSKYLNPQIKCHVCNEKVTICKNILSDRQKKILDDTVVNCKDCKKDMTFKEFREHGEKYRVIMVTCPKCSETIKNNKLKNHALICDYSERICSACNLKLLKKDFDNHIKTFCPKKVIICNKCSTQYLKINETQHSLNCPMNITNCSCGAEYYRKNMYEHKKICPEAYVLCKFYVGLKCNFQDKRKNIKNHECTHYKKDSSGTNDNNFFFDSLENIANLLNVSPEENLIPPDTSKSIYNITTDKKIDEQTLSFKNNNIDYDIGTYWDLCDTTISWEVARIIDSRIVNNVKELYFTYINWGPNYDEWVRCDSKRILPLGTITRHNPYVGKRILAKFDKLLYPCTIVKIYAKVLFIARNGDFKLKKLPYTRLCEKSREFVNCDLFENFKIDDVVTLRYNAKYIPAKIIDMTLENVKFSIIESSDDFYKGNKIMTISYENVCSGNFVYPLYMQLY
jgi:hypothetical protein